MLRAFRARKSRRHAQLNSAVAAAYDLSALEPRILLARFGTVGDGDINNGDLIGGTIFFDNNNANAAGGNAGSMTNDDNGIPNVEVRLTAKTGGAVKNVVSNNGSDGTLPIGGFLFSDLADGTYTLTVVPPPTYLVSPPGTAPNIFANSVFSQTTDTVTVTVTANANGNQDNSRNENCGMYTTTDLPPFIGGELFNDANANGLIDPGEKGIAGAEVDLLNPDGTIAASTLTGVATSTIGLGKYAFPAIVFTPTATGATPLPFDTDYRVQFILPGSGFAFISNKEVNNSPTVYSWVDTVNAITDPITVNSRRGITPRASDTAQTDVDCGFYNLTVTVKGPVNAVPGPDPDDNNKGILRPLSGTALAIFTVEISPLIPIQESVPWFTSDGPARPGGTLLGETIDAAVAGTDYDAASGVLQYNVSTKPVTLQVNVTVLGYIAVLNDRQFTLNITPPPGFLTNPTPPQVQCVILNSSFPQATIGNSTEVRPTNTTADFLFDVNLTAPVGFTGTFTAAPFVVDVDYNTEDFSGKQPNDYTLTTGTIEFDPPDSWTSMDAEGDVLNTGTVTFDPPNGLTMVGSISVPVTPTTDPQLQKQFNVLVVVPTNNTSTIGTPTFGVGTITPNTLPQLSITGSSVTESLLGLAQLPFTITLDPALPTPVTVDYSTSDGTAIAGLDYIATSGSFVFTPGQVTQTIYVPVYRRFLAAQQKTLNMSITTPTPNINPITPTAVGTIQDLALVALPFGGKKKATYTDYLGDPVNVGLNGPGTGNVVFIGNTSVNTNAFEILVDGATSGTTLAVNVRGAKQTSFQNILVTSSIGSIQAKSSNILGLITISGSLNNLALNYMAGVDLTVGNGTGVLNLNLGQSVGTTITSAIPIGNLTALAYLSNSSTPVDLTAPAVGNIKIKGLFGGTVVQAQSIGAVTANGGINGVSLLAGESLGPIVAKGIANSIFFAGMSGSLSTLPTTSADFVNKSASIASVKSTGGAASAFSNTIISAWRIGAVNLGKITTANGSVPFGVAGDQIASVIGLGTSAIHLVNINDLTPPLTQGDFNVRPF